MEPSSRQVQHVTCLQYHHSRSSQAREAREAPPELSLWQVQLHSTETGRRRLSHGLHTMLASWLLMPLLLLGTACACACAFASASLAAVAVAACVPRSC